MTNKKNGSVTVFIMVMFVSLITLIFTFINGAKMMGVKSTTFGLGQLWSTSILAEYDLNLEKRYSIFGYYGMPKDIRKKIDMYAKYSFDEKKYITYSGCSCSLYEFSLINVDVFKKQIVQAGKLLFLEKLKDPEEIIKAEGSEEGIINNEKILKGLPSAGIKGELELGELVSKVKECTNPKDLIKGVSNEASEIGYTFKYFKSMGNNKNLGKTFFQNEIEYIVCGEKSDQKNVQSVKNKIIGIRNLLNYTFALKNPKMSEEAMVAAEVITPGPEAAITQKVLLGAWALAESYNDYKLLVNGKRIPTIKTEASWATDLDSIINNTSAEYIDVKNEEGLEYEDYLLIFISTTSENIRLLRMMDLIQINMKYLYYSNFMLRDYNGGISMSLNVNGDSYNVKKEY